MLQEFIALDLETTGIDTTQDEIIEVGLVKFNRHDIVATYETLIKPTIPLPNLISLLTTITPIMLETAPLWERKKTEIQQFLDTHALVGHNVAFDISFLKQQGITVSPEQFDTFVVSSMLEPHLPSYKLSYLADYFQVTLDNNHRALPDALATAKIFQKLLQKMEDLPTSLQAQFNLIGTKTKPYWPIYNLLPQPTKKTSTFTITVPKNAIKTPAKKKYTHSPIAFSALRNYVEKEDQEFVTTLIDHLKKYTRVAVEENGLEEHTVIGCAWLLVHGKNQPLVLSYATKNKQKKLIDAVLFWQTKLRLPLSFHLMKSQQNFLCPQRLQYFLEKKHFSILEANFLAKILLWLTHTTTGDKDEIFINPEELKLWQRINSNTRFCSVNQCTTKKHRCFHRQNTPPDTDIIVCHHTVLTEYRAEYVLLFEADLLTRSISQQFSQCIEKEKIGTYVQELTSNQILPSEQPSEQLSLFSSQTSVLTYTEPYGLIEKLIFALRKNNCGDAHFFQSIEDVKNNVPKIYTNTTVLWEHFNQVVQQAVAQPTTARKTNSKILLHELKQNNAAWSKFEIFWKTNKLSFEICTEKIIKLNALLETVTPLLPESNRLPALTCKDYLEQLQHNLEQLILFCTDTVGDNWIRWLHWTPAIDTIHLHLTPLDLMPLLQPVYDQSKQLLVLTPTSSIDSRDTFFLTSIGLPQQTPTLHYGTSIKTNIYIPDDLVAPGTPDYQNFLAKKIDTLANQDPTKSTLVVFSSQTQLLTCYERLQKQREQTRKSLQIIAQNMPHSIIQITEKITSSTPALFLVTLGFIWQQTCIPHLGKAILIKLPFYQPNPVSQARSQRYSNGFEQYTLPLTILYTKKILHMLCSLFPKNYTPKLYLLDERLYSKEYGQRIRENL